MSNTKLQGIGSFFYECYLSLKSIRKSFKGKAAKRKFYAMSDGELRNMDCAFYKERIGHELDWNHLTTYTEKMQWEKLYNNDPRKVICTDKYAVREWVKERIGEDYLIPLVGIWEKYSEIDFRKLPEQFVMKTNHGSGDVCIVKEKSKLTLTERLRMRRIIKEAFAQDYSMCFCEMHYGKILPKIIAEQYIACSTGELMDYKFLCFDGKPYYCWVDVDRYGNHQRNMYDMEWNLQPWNQNSFPNTDEDLPKPENFEKMVELAAKLSEGFAHVRVDLYNVDGKILFGEMTFTNGSGFKRLYPEEMDQILGDMWNLDMKRQGEA